MQGTLSTYNVPSQVSEFPTYSPAVDVQQSLFSYNAILSVDESFRLYIRTSSISTSKKGVDGAEPYPKKLLPYLVCTGYLLVEMIRKILSIRTTQLELVSSKAKRSMLHDTCCQVLVNLSMLPEVVLLSIELESVWTLNLNSLPLLLITILSALIPFPSSRKIWLSPSELCIRIHIEMVSASDGTNEWVGMEKYSPLALLSFAADNPVLDIDRSVLSGPGDVPYCDMGVMWSKLGPLSIPRLRFRF
jgi:hypothetical protein